MRKILTFHKFQKTTNKTFLPGDFIFREGEYGKVAYVIEEGDIELVKFTGDDYVTLAEISKGALFGEMAIIDGSPRSGSARAKTSCVLREVSEEQLKKYLSASPQTSLDMMRRLAGYARSANEKLNRDAFESDEKESNEQNSKLENSQIKKEKIDNFTNKTLKEFNDNIDQFSDINPNKTLFISGLIIIIAPDKPPSIADHLKKPTFSPRNRIERIQIKIGITCDKASALLISK